jgi:hypothetical protein
MATVNQGVLKIQLTTIEEAKGMKIEIQGG